VAVLLFCNNAVWGACSKLNVLNPKPSLSRSLVDNVTLVLAMLPLLCRYAAQGIVESRSGKQEHRLIGSLPMFFKLTHVFEGMNTSPPA
jgi:hypothetical protein